MKPDKVILIAEDSDLDLQALRSAILNADVKNPIHVVSDGASAINYLQGNGIYQSRLRYPFPSILILDLNLPMQDGFQVLNHVGEHLLGNTLLKIVLTGYLDRRLIDRAYGLGANSFLHKPARTADLKNLISFFPEYWNLDAPAATPVPLSKKITSSL